MRRIFAILLGVTLLPPTCWASDQAPLSDQKTKDSYSLGYEFGNNLKRQGVELDGDVLLRAVREGLEGTKPSLGAEEIRTTLVELRKQLMIAQDQRLRDLAAKNLEEGNAFLEANRTKEDVKTLPSGLQYKVLKEGSGAVPKVTDAVTIRYRGTLIDGSEFDRSRSPSEPLNLTGMMKGWQEALQRMRTGSTWQLFTPADLAYGKRRFGRIPPNSVLIFELELVAIADGSQPQVVQTLPPE